MSSPLFTLRAIEPYIHPVTFKDLQEVCTDETLKRLSTEKGLTYAQNSKLYHVHMGWHTNQSQQIEGIFFTIYSHHTIEIFVIKKRHYKHLIIFPTMCQQFPKTPFLDGYAKIPFEICQGDCVEDFKAPFQSEVLPNPDHIRNFSQNSPNMLPSPHNKNFFILDPF